MSDPYAPDVHELPHVIIMYIGENRGEFDLLGPYADKAAAEQAGNANPNLKGREWEVRPIFEG